MRKPWLWLTVALVACSSNADTIKEQYAFSDSAGRTCQATLEKTSTGSPSVNQSVTCQGEGRTCSGDSHPCFVLSVATETEEIRNCPACCKGSSSSFVGAECSLVVCTTKSDCVYAQATCAEGTCLCPGGNCE